MAENISRYGDIARYLANHKDKDVLWVTENGPRAARARGLIYKELKKLRAQPIQVNSTLVRLRNSSRIFFRTYDDVMTGIAADRIEFDGQIGFEYQQIIVRERMKYAG